VTTGLVPTSTVPVTKGSSAASTGRR
jgi:hypothetical protein